jgi:hypothetical protein
LTRRPLFIESCYGTSPKRLAPDAADVSQWTLAHAAARPPDAFDPKAPNSPVVLTATARLRSGDAEPQTVSVRIRVSRSAEGTWVVEEIPAQ